MLNICMPAQNWMREFYNLNFCSYRIYWAISNDPKL